MALPQRAPLHVDFLPIQALRLPGQLGLCMAPGRSDGPAGPRDLREDLRRLRRALGTDLLVTLLTEEELAHLGLSGLFTAAAREGLVSLWFPLAERGAPPSPVRVLWLVEHLLSVLSGSSTVVIHCREGRGRTGLVAAACLRRRGWSAADALAEVRRVRPGAVETPEQEAFLERFT